MKWVKWAVGLSVFVLLGGCGGTSARRGQGDSVGGDAGGEASESGGTPAGGAMAASGAPGAAGEASGGTSGTGAGGSSGSAVTGDAGSGGEAGGEPALPLPPGCEARAQEATETSCSLSAYCSVQSQTTQCTRVDSGRWQCRCQRPDRVYEIEGAAGLEACAVAAGACAVKDADLGEESCEPRIDDSDDDLCRMTLACSREAEVDFAPDARAWLVREGWAECHLTGDRFDCQCMYGGQLSEYNLFADSAGSACRPLVDFCMTASEPELTEEERCVLESATTNGDGCERLEGCSKLMPIGDDVDLAQLEPHYATCVPGAGGGSDCYCSTHATASYNLQIETAPSDATCAFAQTICREGVDIEPTGPASCEVTSQIAFGASCEADLSCTRPATVDGQPLVAGARLLVRCARNADYDPWRCACASDQQTATFTLGAADASPWSACNQAPAGCLERLDVHLGAYGDLVYPSYPLSD